MKEVEIVGVRNAAGPNGEDVVSEVSGELFLPKDPEIFDYDDDGNLLEDGRWTYEWDAESRLVSMETRLELSSVLPRQRLEFGYDLQGRRIQKTVMECDGSWQVVADCYFHYRGWNLVAELDETETVLKSYLWGLDLSGTLEGAGGVGALLAIRDHAENAVYYTAYDGNGNVTALIDSADATVAALYEYGPFGESIRTSAPAADINPFRFSTKYFDVETDLYYYGYRYYSPGIGGWLNRDPINEPGHMLVRGETKNNKEEELNLYAMVRNDPVNAWDLLGLLKVCIRPLEACKFTMIIVHCYLDLENGETYGYNDEGIHSDNNPDSPKKRCVDIVPGTITADEVREQIEKDKNSGNWNGGEYGFLRNNCCHWVNHVLKSVGSQGVESYFPGYKCPTGDCE